VSTTSNLWLGHAVRPEQDPQFIRDTIADVDALAATDAERRIYEGTPARSFGVSGNSICFRAPPQPTSVGTDKQTSRTPYKPCCRVLTGNIRRLSCANA